MNDQIILENVVRCFARKIEEYSAEDLKFLLEFSVIDEELRFRKRDCNLLTVKQFNKLHRLAYKPWHEPIKLKTFADLRRVETSQIIEDEIENI